tara:strand:- start:511 stop:915 length:405 start_codon:yes stop_codon:yes gene_type:complete
MSLVKTDALQGKTSAKTVTVTVGSTATQALEVGLAKVWLNYFQQTPAIRDSLNVSAVTDIATGRYAPVYVTNMNTAIYCVTCNSIGFANHFDNASGAASEASMTSSDCDIQGNNSANGTADSALTCFLGHGSLA